MDIPYILVEFQMGQEEQQLSKQLQQILDRYRGLSGDIDYFSLLSDKAIVDYAESLAEFDIDSLETNAQRLAFWINCYNALSIYGVVKKIQSDPDFAKTGHGNWFKRVRFFALNRYTVAGKKYTLRQIENYIRKEFNEPRIHFALNCASSSCPILKDGLYSPENIEEELNTAAKLFIRNQRGSQLNKEEMILRLSAIFKWYREDFEATGKTLPQYVAEYLPKEDQEFILKNGSKLEIQFLDYNWSLNIITESEES
jgi:hypothetical protein